jgi:hypothetical protein
LQASSKAASLLPSLPSVGYLDFLTAEMTVLPETAS